MTSLVIIASILVRLSRILHDNGTATAVLAVPVPPPLVRIIISKINFLEYFDSSS